MTRLGGRSHDRGTTVNEQVNQAKIIEVADVVEAMASHRPYRASLGIDKAIEEVVQKRGIFYDTDVVNACEEVVRENGFLSPMTHSHCVFPGTQRSFARGVADQRRSPSDKVSIVGRVLSGIGRM